MAESWGPGDTFPWSASLLPLLLAAGKRKRPLPLGGRFWRTPGWEPRTPQARKFLRSRGSSPTLTWPNRFLVATEVSHAPGLDLRRPSGLQRPLLQLFRVGVVWGALDR